MTVERHVDDLELDFDHLIEDVSEDRARLTLVGVDCADHSGDMVERQVAAAVAEVLQAHTELQGWGSRVLLRPGEEPDGMDLDAEAAALVPDGETLADHLAHAIEYERSVYADAQLLRAWDPGSLVVADLDELSPRERDTATRRASALAGYLILASVTMVDQLFDDVEVLRGASRDEVVDIDATWILSGLPSRFAERYHALFAQEFLVAAVDLTSRLTGTWSSPVCVAQELALRLLLDQVEVVAEGADVELEAGWRAHLEDMLFDDLDHEFLYDPAWDRIEDDPSVQPPGMASLKFEDWFAPFNDECALPPYLLPPVQGENG